MWQTSTIRIHDLLSTDNIMQKYDSAVFQEIALKNTCLLGCKFQGFRRRLAFYHTYS